MLYFAGVDREGVLLVQANLILVVVGQVKNFLAAKSVAITIKKIAALFSIRKTRQIIS